MCFMHLSSDKNMAKTDCLKRLTTECILISSSKQFAMTPGLQEGVIKLDS